MVELLENIGTGSMNRIGKPVQFGNKPIVAEKQGAVAILVVLKNL